MIHKPHLGWCPELLAPHNVIRISDLVMLTLILTELTSRVLRILTLEGRILCGSVRYPEKLIYLIPFNLLFCVVPYISHWEQSTGQDTDTLGFLGIA
jgi:hypothetical protein